MKYLLLIYNDQSMLDALPEGEFEAQLRECYAHADGLVESGHLLGSQRLEPPASASTVRIRNGQMAVTDGPFAETKEHLGGFNIIEAKDLNEAIRLASEFPWARTGSIEVRPIAQSIPA